MFFVSLLFLSGLTHADMALPFIFYLSKALIIALPLVILVEAIIFYEIVKRYFKKLKIRSVLLICTIANIITTYLGYVMFNSWGFSNFELALLLSILSEMIIIVGIFKFRKWNFPKFWQILVVVVILMNIVSYFLIFAVGIIEKNSAEDEKVKFRDRIECEMCICSKCLTDIEVNNTLIHLKNISDVYYRFCDTGCKDAGCKLVKDVSCSIIRHNCSLNTLIKMGIIKC